MLASVNGTTVNNVTMLASVNATTVNNVTMLVSKVQQRTMLPCLMVQQSTMIPCLFQSKYNNRQCYHACFSQWYNRVQCTMLQCLLQSMVQQCTLLPCSLQWKVQQRTMLLCLFQSTVQQHTLKALSLYRSDVLVHTCNKKFPTTQSPLVLPMKRGTHFQ